MKILVAIGAIALVAVGAASTTMGGRNLVGDADPGLGVAQGTRARIVALGNAPLILKGTGFVGGENVQVAVLGSTSKLTRRVKAGGTGGFRVLFRTVFDSCNILTVRAVGDRGSRASLQLSHLAPFACAFPGPKA